METLQIEFDLDLDQVAGLFEVLEIVEREAEGWKVSSVAIYPEGGKPYRTVVTFVREAAGQADGKSA